MSDILILAFVVFNPGDLYYLGYKKIITIIIYSMGVGFGTTTFELNYL